MEVPQDYVFELFKNAIDERFQSIEQKMDWQNKTSKEDMTEIKVSILKCQKSCSDTRKEIDIRLKQLEEFKIKIYAYSGAIGTISAFAWTWISKNFGG